jgi:cell division protein FtsZ
MNAATEDDISRVVSTLYADALEPTICAMGCGGAGCNIVSLVHRNSIEGIRTIAMNVDREALENTEAETKICLNRKREPRPGTLDYYDDLNGLCEVAGQEALEAVQSGILFLITGMGGKTGTALAPAIAEAAKKKGIVTIAIAISPFSEEGRSEAAEKGIQDLREHAECVIALENDSLKEVGMDLPFNQLVNVMNEMVAKVVENVKDWISHTFLATIAGEVDAVAQEFIHGPDMVGIGLGMSNPPEAVEAEIDPIAMGPNGMILRR